MLTVLMGTRSLVNRLTDDAGQGLVEYSLILVFIAVIAIGALTFLGSDVSSALSSVANGL